VLWLRLSSFSFDRFRTGDRDSDRDFGLEEGVMVNRFRTTTSPKELDSVTLVMMAMVKMTMDVVFESKPLLL
jgi:hypothetical protein